MISVIIPHTAPRFANKQENDIERRLVRNCPKCGKKLVYNGLYSKQHYNQAVKKCQLCMSCSKLGCIPWNKGKTGIYSTIAIEKMRRAKDGFLFTNEHRQKISNALLNNHPFRGKHHSNESRNKISQMTKIAMMRPGVYRKLGHKHSIKTKLKMRLSAINRLNTQIGQITPNYNPIGCQRIDEYGKQYGYNFQHAMNGGEFHIKELGYWVDGYDKDKNVVVEYYERRHNRQKHIIKDIQRKHEIMKHLGCKFIEITEWKI